MQDQPTPAELIGAVAGFLRTGLSAEAGQGQVFQARVAANALEIARRELELAPATDAAESTRLRLLLDQDLDLRGLNQELANRIADGSVGLATPGLADHLFATAIAKLAVDQPTYVGYRRALAERDERDPR